MPLLTLLVCFIKFMDQNTLDSHPLLPFSLHGQIPAAVAGSLPRRLPPLLVRGQAGKPWGGVDTGRRARREGARARRGHPGARPRRGGARRGHSHLGAGAR